MTSEGCKQSIVDYRELARELMAECAGFETDIHGIGAILDDCDVRQFFADCVRAA